MTREGNDAHGRVETEGDRARIVFERTLAAPVERVWELLATADGLTRWLADATIDLRPGGKIAIEFDDDGAVDGEIIEVAVHSVLEYQWRFSGESDSVLRFELTAVDPATTHLRLDHRLLPANQAAGYGAGWHAHLDRLAALAAGGEPGVWEDLFRQFLPAYAS